MTSRCCGDSRGKDWRNASARFFFCKKLSGSSAVSGTVDTVASSNSASVRRARLERGGMAPYVEKHFTQEVLGQGFIVYETQQPPINPHPMPCEERSHSRLVACSDPSGQRFIGRTFTSRCPL